jgi:hypothetical protein
VGENALASVLTAAYRPYVVGVLAARGWEMTGEVDRSLDEGEAWLASQLEALLSLPFADQTRGPLEIFQEAMRFPTDALDAEGIPVVRRDQVAANALPGDVYDLAPASSRDLGDEVWVAHLQWGAHKAAALRDR